ncbi:hypothetical protein KKE60_08310 [Patescibacteria group bacterium]|nr:hypothetical protein [Patescibacteria group bacterium]
MSTIRVRRLDENWDPVYGSGVDDYIFDQEAVIQIIESRLRLWQGEWWENLKEGVPMFQRILGKLGTSKAVVDRLIQTNILGSPHVIGIVKFVSEFNSTSRGYECEATVNTEFGTLIVTNV